MNTITEDKIKEIVGGLNSLGNDPLTRLFEKMDAQQHYITEYLFEVEGDYLNEDERDLLISFTTLGWHIINETLKIEREINDDELSARLDYNADLLHEIENEMKDFDEALSNIFNEDNDEPFLMLFLMGLVIDRPPEYGGTIREEMVPVIIMHIKTVMDCLLASIVH